MAARRKMASYLAAMVRIRASLWISLLFAGVAAVFVVAPSRWESPVTEAVVISAPVRDTTPVRTPSPRAEIHLGRFTLRCNECHRILPAPYIGGPSWLVHTNVQLAHGINSRCLNCHHAANRETFTDDYGNEIPWDQPQLLCAKCHGPVYRDWQHGSHGRINGYWDPSRGPQVKLKCVRCHDPHHPRFPPLASDPGPHTIRVHPRERVTHSETRNPLRIKDNLLTDQYSSNRGDPK